MAKKFLLIFISISLIYLLPKNANAATATYDNSANSSCNNSATPCVNGTTLTYPLTVGNNSNSSYSFSNVTTNHTISAIFTLPTNSRRF